MDSARRVITRILNPRFLSSTTSYDAASNVHQSLIIEYNDIGTIHQSLVLELKRHPMTWRALSTSPCLSLVTMMSRRIWSGEPSGNPPKL